MKVKYAVPVIKRIYYVSHLLDKYVEYIDEAIDYKVVFEGNDDFIITSQVCNQIKIDNELYNIKEIYVDPKDDSKFVILDKKIIEEDIDSLKKSYQEVVRFLKEKREELESQNEKLKTELENLRNELKLLREDVKKNYRRKRKWFKFKK